MGRGLHSWIAIALTVAAIVLGVVARGFAASVLALLFLAAATSLLGEIPRLLRTGEIRARKFQQVKEALLKPRLFLVIRREDSPGRFYFYVILYAVLGVFSLLLSSLFFLQLLVAYVGK
ncbi:MAG: hypothetical protein A2100_04375 [Sideroxydans sp. GWF2_59_14]|nr:MAG: hypothetical protein A2100_04375 [Sideroxydans sp. GWF2_59_14]